MPTFITSRNVFRRQIYAVFTVVYLMLLTACDSSSNGNSTQPTSGDVSSSIVTTPAAEPTPADDPEEDNSPLLLNITLSWEIPATREDGSALPLNEIGGYEITYLLDGQLQHFSINDAQTTSTTLTQLANTNYTFSIYTFDHNNLVSSSASQVSYIANSPQG